MSTFSLKEGVNIFGLHSECLWAIDRCVEASPTDVTVTSTRGDKHSRGSLHYAGHAFDLRTRDLSSTQITTWVNQMKLGDDFDIVIESNHIHVEYQPKDAKPISAVRPYR